MLHKSRHDGSDMLPEIVKRYKNGSKHMQTVMKSHENACLTSERLDKSNRKCYNISG